MKYAINLLPQHLRPQTGIAIRHICWAAIAGVLLVCGLLYGGQLFKEQLLRRELAQVNRQIQEIRPLVRQVQENNALQRQIAAREDTLQQISKERARYWSELLLQLGQATPENLWLTQVSSDTEGVIRLRGSAKDIDAVMQYIANLKQNSQFANISFQGLTQGNAGDKAANPAEQLAGSPANLVAYELGIEIKGAVMK